ncbi:hypothetical protein [Rouxiella sp. WC2420]|uniref:SET domain-containing protein n=1 Tax=Rouxiella sp. WC2420 TaxID=3234145 RepID=A0AB39VVF9_9GAMM
MSDFSILTGENVLITPGSSTSQAAAGSNSISNNLLDVSHSIKIPASQPPATTPDNQSSIRNSCSVMLRHAFIQTSISVEKKRAEVIGRLTAQQNNLLNCIVNHTECLNIPAKSVTAWMDNLPAMDSHDIKPKDFSEFCYVNYRTFQNYINQEKKARLPLTLFQQTIVEQVILDAQCFKDPGKASRAWIANQTTLQNAGIIPAQFARLNEVTPHSLVVIVNRLQSRERLNTGLPRLIIDFGNNDQKFINNVIKSYGCRCDTIKSVFAWLDNKYFFKVRGISLSRFARGCGVKENTLIKSILRIKRRSGNQPQPVIDTALPFVATNKSIEPQKTAIAGIMHNEPVNDSRNPFSERSPLPKKAVINNSQPIYHHPDNPRKSLIYEVLGLDSHAQVKDIEVTDWGSMKAVFGTMPKKNRIRLELKIITELHRQIMEGTQQSERMNSLMKNVGSHSLSQKKDEELNSRRGVFNPGPNTVAANTVLGFYPDVNNWGSSSEKFSTDAFASGNILRNMTPNNLPKEFAPSGNNIAAVQINNRLMAYITTREVEAGERYFVDFD